MRIWRGSMTDGNIAIFLEADAAHMDLLSGATWSVLGHHEVDVHPRLRQSRQAFISVVPSPAQMSSSEAHAWFCAAFVRVTPCSHARAHNLGDLVAFRSSCWWCCWTPIFQSRSLDTANVGSSRDISLHSTMEGRAVG